MVVEFVTKGEDAVCGTGEAAEQDDAVGAQRLQADRMGGAEQRARRRLAVGLDEFPARHVGKAGYCQPVEAVPAAIAANEPARAARRQEHAASCVYQILSNLTARLAASHDEHSTFEEICRLS